MVYLPFSSVYTRDGSIYAVQVPRDVQDVLEGGDFKEKDSHVGVLQVSLDGYDMPDAAKDYGKKYPAFLCPHTGVAKGWPPCQDRKEPDDVTEALIVTAKFLAEYIESPYAKCLGLARPSKKV